jgi:hypothetical protein
MTSPPGTRPSLTDRYLAAVTQHLPPDQAGDVARELRTTIEDAVEAKVADGSDPAAAERQVLVEMGRPEVLSADYGGRPLWLVGPALYPDYVRLLRLVVPTVLVALAVVWVLGLVVDGVDSVGEVVTRGLGLLWQGTVQVFFWVTVVFVVLERVRPEAERSTPLVAWTPEQLADLPAGSRIGRVETAFGLLFLGVLLLLVLDNLAGVSFGTDFVQVLDDDMPTAGKVALVAVLVAAMSVESVKLVRCRWTTGLAAANAVVDLTFLAVAGVLWSRGELLDPGLAGTLDTVAQAVGTSTAAAWWEPTVAVTLGVVVVVTLWDAVDGFRRARRTDPVG